MPVSCALDQACGQNTLVPPWEERRLVALCRPPGRMQAAPAPKAEQAEVSLASSAQGTLWKFKSRGHYPRTSATLTTGK